MVRKKSRMIRTGDYFSRYTADLSKELGVSRTELTDGLASFLEQENLTPIIKRRVRRGRRWWE